ncbi:hypothetical protein GC197_05295 [bacterium]|nr:hypothetical protein [bacterium]
MNSGTNPFGSPAAETTSSASHPRSWPITVVVVLTWVLLLMFLGMLLGFGFLFCDLLTSDGFAYVQFGGDYRLEFNSFRQRDMFLLFLIVLGFALAAAYTLLTAIGLQYRRKWGRLMAIGLGLVGLVAFFCTLPSFWPPTLIWGIYGMLACIVLLRQSIRLQFQHGRALPRALESDETSVAD